MSFPLTPRRSPATADPGAPLRFAEGGGTDYERRLLGSAQNDAPPLASAERIASALRAAVADGRLDSMPADPAQAAGASNALRTVKPWAFGIMGAGVIGAILASQWPSKPDVVSVHPTSRAVVSTPAVSDAISVPAPNLTPPAPPLPVEPEPSAANPPKSNRARLGRSQRARPPAAARAPIDGASSLAAEVRAIETIQTLLAWGQAQQAESALAKYRREFPQGELALEAELLDVDVALARGDRTRARSLARSLLERPSASRYRDRLSGLLEADARPQRNVADQTSTRQSGTGPLGVGSNSRAR